MPASLHVDMDYVYICSDDIPGQKHFQCQMSSYNNAQVMLGKQEQADNSIFHYNYLCIKLHKSSNHTIT
jgi:hypothetical protein